MQIPPPLLRGLCALLTVTAYYLVIFTDWGSPYRSRSTMEAMILDACVVLAAFACWELFRTEKMTPLRAVAAAVGVPLALFALLTLWYGVRRYTQG